MTKLVRRPWLLILLFAVMAGARLDAQTVSSQQLALAGLRASGRQGQFNAVAVDASGNLILLLDQKDGVRLLKTDATASTVLAQALIGASGDIGLAMALDPAGNIYVTGTTTSGSLTATPGAAFSSRVDTTVNAFVAKFDGSLNLKFTTFGGSARTAATAVAASSDAVFITGLIYGNGLPVTPGGIIQAPTAYSSQNGFVERFSADGTTLSYATYISGQGSAITPSVTSPTVIAVDAQDDAYIAGFTTASGFPTVAALVPRFSTESTTSGFLTELTPAGDGLNFSTFIPAGGINSLAIDSTSKTLLLSGAISLGEFPVSTVTMPLVNTPYQVLVRLPLDGSAVLSSTVIAPGPLSYIAPGANGTVWVDGTLQTPLLPGTPLSNVGTGFAVRVSPAPAGAPNPTVIDQTARFGGLAAANPNYASLIANLTSLAVDGTGSAIIAGSMSPSASSSLLATQTFDLPLTNAPTSALPSTIHDAVVSPASCTNSSACAGSAAYLARVTPTDGVSLALSTDAAPTITLRNLGSVQAAGLQVAVTGFTLTSNCGTTLNAGGECTILLNGSGPGALTVSASNATTQTASLPANPVGVAVTGLVFFPKELDFGVQTSTSPPRTQTITITNLGTQSRTFTSALNGRAGFTPFTFAESASDCNTSGLSTNKQLDAGATCHVTLSLQASSNATRDGPATANWMIGTGNVLLTGFGQADSLNLSATTIDFGTQFYGGLLTSRALYISNSSSVAITHTPVTLPAPFTVTDNCPTQLNPQTVCQILFNYLSAVDTSTDSTTLALDNGLSVLVKGQTIPQPGTRGSTPPPSLVVTPSSLGFPTPVVVTGVSGNTPTVTIQNTGTSSFALGLSLTGDFTDQTNCPSALAAGASCSVIVTFAPSQPGARQGLLGVTAGASSPSYVALSGTGTAILPANNGTLDFGIVPVAQPSVQWYKVSQPFSILTVAASPSSTFKVLLVEDIGYGHGSPAASAFLSATTGTCANCWLGVQFTPPVAGPQTGSLRLLSAVTGSPYVLALTGNGLAPTGIALSPVSYNFGPIDVSSLSAPQLFTVTNLGATSTTLAAPSLTGDFQLSSAPSGGTACSTSLAGNASCFLQVLFAPTSVGQRVGTLTVVAGTGTATATLSGTGMADPGVAFSTNALIFNNVPGPTATQQTITITNTGNVALQVGTATNGSTAFQTTSTCGALPVAGSCALTITFTPQSATVTDTLQVPVTAIVGGAPVTTIYPVTLSGTYTAAGAGLQITPGSPTALDFGPFPVDTVGATRQFTIGNLSPKTLALNLILPREFNLSGAPCTTLAPAGTCTISLSFLPLTAGAITGSLLAQGTPSDGSAPVNGIGYLQGFGNGTATFSISGNLQPGAIVDFGQVASGQSATQTLTFTNNTSASASQNTVTIRRITSRWPFLATTTCGAPLARTQSCTATLTYTPLNQIASGGTAPPPTTDTGSLVIESDASGSPQSINLTATSIAAAVSAPTNTAPISTFTASESALTFATTAVGFNSAPQSVTLTNTGTTPLHVTSLAATSDFAVSGSCAAVLPGATCVFNVIFAPQITSQASGSRIGAVEITSDSSTALELISLLGDASPANLTFQPTALVFGTVLVGRTATLPLQITNTGATAAVLSAITLGGDFSVDPSSTCPGSGGTLAPNAACTLQVVFTPTAAGLRNGTASVASSASTNPLTVALQGTGSQSALQITPISLNFGNVAAGSSTSLALTLVNSGTGSITGITFVPTGDFSIATPCGVTVLAAGASCSVTVAFTPSSLGARTGTLTIASTDPASPKAIPLTGSGVPPLQVAPAALGFGNAALGTTVTLPLTLTNAGTIPITGLGLTATGDFAVTTPCAATLAGGASCTAMVAFNPTATGARTGTLTIAGSAPGSPSVALTGAGTSGSGAGPGTGTFGLTVDGGSTSTATVIQTHPAAYTLTVTPQGGFTGQVVLTCSPMSSAAAPYAACSILPAAVTLGQSPQTAMVTINTLTSAGNVFPRTRFDGTTLCLLAPAVFLFWRLRKALPRQRLTLLLALVCTSLMLLVSGCGGGNNSLKVTPPGDYQFTVVGSSTTGTVASQTVTLKLVVN